MKISSNNRTKQQEAIFIFNILRSIGLITSLKGTKFINKAVQLILTSDSDIISIENIYTKVANFYNNTTSKQVKNDIAYAINHRIEEKTIKNFEKIFGFEYDEYVFTNKNIIEEIARVVLMKV